LPFIYRLLRSRFFYVCVHVHGCTPLHRFHWLDHTHFTFGCGWTHAIFTHAWFVTRYQFLDCVYYSRTHGSYGLPFAFARYAHVAVHVCATPANFSHRFKFTFTFTRLHAPLLRWDTHPVLHAPFSTRLGCLHAFRIFVRVSRSPPLVHVFSAFSCRVQFCRFLVYVYHAVVRDRSYTLRCVCYAAFWMPAFTHCACVATPFTFRSAPATGLHFLVCVFVRLVCGSRSRSTVRLRFAFTPCTHARTPFVLVRFPTAQFYVRFSSRICVLHVPVTRLFFHAHRTAFGFTAYLATLHVRSCTTYTRTTVCIFCVLVFCRCATVFRLDAFRFFTYATTAHTCLRTTLFTHALTTGYRSLVRFPFCVCARLVGLHVLRCCVTLLQF